MKTLIILIISLFYLSAKAQDTLVFTSGKIQLVDLISVSKDLGLIKYSLEGKTQICSIYSLKSYSNHANITDDKWNIENGSVDPLPGGTPFNSSSAQDPGKYSYGKISIGLNTFSALSVKSISFLQGISSNFHQSIYLQYNLNNRFGLRLPVRVGFNQLKNSSHGSLDYEWQHSHDLFYELGLEPVIMKDDNQKITTYFLPGIYIGRNQSVVTTGYDTISYNSIFIPTPKRFYYRVGFSFGFQFNISKTFQLNTELGLNLNNCSVYYYYINENPQINFVHNRLSLQSAVNLVYRFGGKLRE